MRSRGRFHLLNCARRTAVACLVGCLVAATACAHPGGALQSADEAEASLPVGPVPVSADNRSQYSVTVYAVRGSLRQRIGEVSSLSKAEMVIPESFTNDHGGVSLQVLQVGGPARFVSDRVDLQREQRVVLTIQTRIANSALTVTN